MIEGIEFSERGRKPTSFEMRLLREAKTEHPLLCVARRLIADLGEELGALAVVGVLDELGGEKPHVPKRRHFFDSLWRIERDLLIVDMARRSDWTHADIARGFGVSKSYVHKLVGRPQPQRTTLCAPRGRHASHD